MKPSPELAALFEPVLPWLDAGGDENYTFDMRMNILEGDCGTSCCIVGALGVFNPNMNWGGRPHETSVERASYADEALVEIYGLYKQDRDALFYTYMDLTPAQAATTVRHWIETGYVLDPRPEIA